MTKRWVTGLAIGYASVVACASVRGTVVLSDFTSGVNQSEAMQFNRNSQVLVSYNPAAGARTDQFMVVGSGISTPQHYVVPASLTTNSYDFSNWGIAIDTSAGGFNFSQIYAAPLGNDFVQLQGLLGSGDHSPPRVNDSGMVAWTGRNTVNTGRNLLYRWTNAAGTQQVPAPPGGVNTYNSIAGVDNSGNVLVQYVWGSAQRLGQYNGTNWVSVSSDALANSLFVGESPWRVTPTGQVAFVASRGSPTLSAVALGNGTTFQRLNDINSFTHVQEADNGRLLIRAEPATGSNTTDWNCVIRDSDGTTVDVQTLLPGGYQEVTRPGHAMNYQGDVLVEGFNTVSSKYSYFLYKDGTVRPMLLESERAISPGLTNDDTMYYLSVNGGLYSLTAVSGVPEPATAMVLGGAAAALMMRCGKRR